MMPTQIPCASKSHEMDVLYTVTELSTMSSHSCTGSTPAVMKNPNIHIISIQPEIILLTLYYQSVQVIRVPKKKLYAKIHTKLLTRHITF